LIPAFNFGSGLGFGVEMIGEELNRGRTEEERRKQTFDFYGRSLLFLLSRIQPRFTSPGPDSLSSMVKLVEEQIQT
jgi:hypothetical protein